MEVEQQNKVCSNCKLFHKVCKSACCGPVPIDKKVFAENQYLLQKPVIETFDLGNTLVPVTEDMTCPFLSSEHACLIYDNRPEVCRKFGDESDLLMTCAYQTVNGKARSRKETRKLLELQQKHMKNSQLLKP